MNKRWALDHYDIKWRIRYLYKTYEVNRPSLSYLLLRNTQCKVGGCGVLKSGSNWLVIQVGGNMA